MCPVSRRRNSRSSSGGTASWQFARPLLGRTLDRWYSTQPTAEMRVLVHESLMDLISDPMRWGREQPEGSGIFTRYVRTAPGLRIGLLYTISDPVKMEVGLAEIWVEP